MSPRSSRTNPRPLACAALAAALLAAAIAHSPAHAQPADEAQRLRAFLERHGLDAVEAADLRRRLREARPDDRGPLASRLADIYVAQLAAAGSPERREHVESLARELVSLVPQEQAGDLRLALVRARYRWAKDLAERARLAAVPRDQLDEAAQALRRIIPELADVAAIATDTAERLERRREAVGLSDSESQRREDAVRVRSTAHYLLGWSRYYAALIGDSPGMARQALRDLGLLLGTPDGKPADVERLDDRMLRFEHVADAAIAAAFCESLLGNDETALRWLEKLRQAGELSEGVRDRLFASRLLVLSRAGRWRDVSYYSDRRRRQRVQDGHEGLAPLEAQLLARLAWEALTEGRLRDRDLSAVEEVAHAALQDLVRQDQIAALRALVERFGTASLEGEGFVFSFVRGQNAFERATDAYEQAGYQGGQVPTEPAIANLYAQAARTLDAALSAPDADAYPAEKAQAMQLAAMATFLGGQPVAAADRFEDAYAQAADTEQAERALWHAIVSLDAAVRKGAKGLQQRRDKLATLYLTSFPSTERAARLLVARAGAAGADDAQAIDVLLGVPKDSPLYEAARRRAERMLFERVRRLTGDRRSAAAARYLTVADELLAIDRRRAAAGDLETARPAAERALALARAMLQTILGGAAPDVDRARALLEVVEDLVARTGRPPDAVASEIAYRRVQLALATGDPDRAARIADALDQDDQPFDALADRAMYANAADRFEDSPANAQRARRVVDAGKAVLAQFADQPEALAQPQVHTAHTTIARAAWVLATDAATPGDQRRAMLDLVLAIDGKLLAADLADAGSLQRLGYAAEAVGRHADALDAWRRLLAAADAMADAGLRARYESARLLARTDRARAADALTQHALLHPDPPPPWGERLASLLEAVRAGSPLPPPLAGPQHDGAESAGSAP